MGAENYHKKFLNDIGIAGLCFLVFLSGFWVLDFSIPFISLSLIGILKIFLFFLALFMIVSKRKKFHIRSTHNLLVLGFLIFSLLSLIRTNDFSSSLRWVFSLLNFVLIYFLIYFFIESEKHILYLSLSIIASAVIHGLLVFISCHSGIGLFANRYISFVRPEIMGSSNYISLLLFSGTILSLYFFYNSYKKTKIFLVFLIFLFISCLLTLSRIGILILMIALAFLLMMQISSFFKGKRNEKPKIIFTISLLVFSLVFVLSVIQGGTGIIRGFCLNDNFFDGMEERMQIIELGVESVQKPDLILGKGANTLLISDEGGNPRLQKRSIHNTFLSVLIEMGIFGFILFLLIVIMAANYFRKSRYKIGFFLFIILICLILASFFHEIDRFYLIWVLAGLSSVIEKKLRNFHENEKT